MYPSRDIRIPNLVITVRVQASLPPDSSLPPPPAVPSHMYLSMASIRTFACATIHPISSKTTAHPCAPLRLPPVIPPVYPELYFQRAGVSCRVNTIRAEKTEAGSVSSGEGITMSVWTQMQLKLQSKYWNSYINAHICAKKWYHTHTNVYTLSYRFIDKMYQVFHPCQSACQGQGYALL